MLHYYKKKLITKALNAAEDNIDEILSDRDISEKLTAFNKNLDNWVEAKLGVNIRDKEELGKYTDVPAIKEAVADAKAEAANKEQYVNNDFDGNVLDNEAKKTIRYAFKEYALVLLEEEYNKEATKDNDKLLRAGVYTTIKKALEDTESEKKYPSITDTKTEIAKLDLEANLKTLTQAKKDYKHFINVRNCSL